MRFVVQVLRGLNLGRNGRRTVGIVLLLTAISRLIVNDPIRPLRFASEHVYGAAGMLIGLALIATSYRAHRLRGQLAALLGWVLFWTWAIDLSARSTVFPAFVIMGLICLREMVHDVRR